MTAVLRLMSASALLVVLTGCNIVAAIGYFTAPRQWQEPEFVIPAGSSMAVLIDSSLGVPENPVFAKALTERTAVLMRQDKDKPIAVASFQQVIDLRRSARGFDQWPVQRIGRELGVDYVLHLIVDNWQVQLSDSAPVIEPRVNMRMKLIDVDAPADMARVWPADERDGRPVEAYRPPKEVHDANPDVFDAETAKLAYDAGFYVTMPFLRIDTEEKPPVAR